MQPTRVMVPAEYVSTINNLGSTALFTVAPDIKEVAPDLTVEVAGIWRTTTHYRFDLKLSSPAVCDYVTIEIEKTQIETNTLTLLDHFPLLKW